MDVDNGSYHGLEKLSNETKRDFAQRKTFLAFMNHVLTGAGHEPEAEPISALKSGVCLARILVALTGREISGVDYNPGENKLKCLNNLQLCLNFARDTGLVLTNIGGNDIYEGNYQLTMGLLWQIVIKYHIAGKLATLCNTGDKNGRATECDMKDSLIAWCNGRLAMVGEIRRVENLTTDFSDGAVLSAITASFDPSFAAVYQGEMQSVHKLRRAIGRSQAILQVPALLSAGDIIDNPDEKAIMTYLAYFVAVEKTQKGVLPVVAVAEPSPGTRATFRGTEVNVKSVERGGEGGGGQVFRRTFARQEGRKATAGECPSYAQRRHGKLLAGTRQTHSLDSVSKKPLKARRSGGRRSMLALSSELEKYEYTLLDLPYQHPDSEPYYFAIIVQPKLPVPQAGVLQDLPHAQAGISIKNIRITAPSGEDCYFKYQKSVLEGPQDVHESQQGLAPEYYPAYMYEVEFSPSEPGTYQFEVVDESRVPVFSSQLQPFKPPSADHTGLEFSIVPSFTTAELTQRNPREKKFLGSQRTTSFYSSHAGRPRRLSVQVFPAQVHSIESKTSTPNVFISGAYPEILKIYLDEDPRLEEFGLSQACISIKYEGISMRAKHLKVAVQEKMFQKLSHQQRAQLREYVQHFAIVELDKSGSTRVVSKSEPLGRWTSKNCPKNLLLMYLPIIGHFDFVMDYPNTVISKEEPFSAIILVTDPFLLDKPVVDHRGTLVLVISDDAGIQTEYEAQPNEGEPGRFDVHVRQLRPGNYEGMVTFDGFELQSKPVYFRVFKQKPILHFKNPIPTYHKKRREAPKDHSPKLFHGR